MSLWGGHNPLHLLTPLSMASQYNANLGEALPGGPAHFSLTAPSVPQLCQCFLFLKEPDALPTHVALSCCPHCLEDSS